MVAILQTVLGGILAAGTGFALTRYEIKHQRKQQRQEWVNRLERLINRLDTGYSEDNTNTSKRRGHINIIVQTVELLEEHLSHTNQTIPPQLSEQFEIVRVKAAFLEIRREQNIVNDDIPKKMQEISELSKNMQDEAQNLRIDTRGFIDRLRDSLHTFLKEYHRG